MRTLIILISLFASIVATAQSSMLLIPEYKRYKTVQGVDIDYHLKKVIVENEPLVIAKKIIVVKKVPVLKVDTIIQFRQPVLYEVPKIGNIPVTPVSKTELIKIPVQNYKTVPAKKGYGLFYGGVASQVGGAFILYESYKPLKIHNKIDITSSNVNVKNEVSGGGFKPLPLAIGSGMIIGGYFLEKAGVKRLQWNGSVITFIF
jgi:hypothetical protein